MESEICITVRSTDIDVNGHVNNAKYLEYLEWGRDDWFERTGSDYDTLLAEGIITVMVHLEANYRHEVRKNEQLAVRTRLLRVGRTSFTMHQEIFRLPERELVFDADVVLVCISTTQRSPVPVPASIRRCAPDTP
ncbi:thioesterase [Alicyclobacillus cellulosilyticus]|uniref:Thioesterase n=1 Tax=Alicyclobacillus cellulosilyticus TaxID=1003997 RepID=A0A917JZQ3_9BACL|nr:thioesterase family protein [Alicyclobacillus cellulosilyticus]GGI94992.1 thioesterase [Alicyclobacillus cellulosilyticus]